MIPEILGLATNDVVKLVVALAAGGMLSEALKWVRDRKQMDASTAKSLTEATVLLLAPLSAQLEDEQGKHSKCRLERDRFEEDNREKTAEIFVLKQQLRACEERTS